MYHPSYDYDRQLLDTFASKEALTVIDYGCGNGILIDFLGPERFKKYIGFEVSKAALAVAKQKYRGKKYAFHHFTPGVVPTLGSAQSADVIILIGVLQYMTKSEITQFFKQAYQVLKPGGFIIASCVVDHLIYRSTNLYNLFFPNYYLNRQALLTEAKKRKFLVLFAQEKGLLVGPLFSHGLVIFFDLIDKIIFRNKGKLGPIGIGVRKLFKPLMSWEYQLPLDYGYTLFVTLKKK